MNISSGSDLKDINQGPGTIFLGNANSTWDLNALQTVGTHGKNGFTVDPEEEFFLHEDCNGRTLEGEIIKQGASIKFDILQFNYKTWAKLFGHGSFTSTEAGTETITDMKVELNGYDWTELPGKNVTVTSINDGGATPVDYSVVANQIEYDNSNTAGNNKGYIRRKRTTTTIPDGATVYINGTFGNGVRKTWLWTPDNVTNYYPMRIKQKRKNNNLLIFDFWKVQRVGKIETLEFKLGAPTKIGITMSLQQDLGEESLGRIIEERPI